MRTAFVALLVAVAACSSPQTAKPVAEPQKAVNIAGRWTWEQNPESLDLILKQDGAAISGYHSAVGERGNKVDEVTLESGAEPSIKGEMKGTVGTVRFRSGYPDSKGGGTATLTLRGGVLYWQIIKSDGEHYLPKVARLRPSKQR
jgi:hypothetical protein